MLAVFDYRYGKTTASTTSARRGVGGRELVVVVVRTGKKIGRNRRGRRWCWWEKRLHSEGEKMVR